MKHTFRAEVADDDVATVGDISRDIIIVPETTALSDLLGQFRENEQQMAAVIHEWGSFEGIAYKD